MKPEKEIELLLPWLHNGTLQGEEEVVAIDFEKSQRDAGDAEKHFDDVLKSVLTQQEVDSPGQFGWYRLQRDIATLPQKKTRISKASSSWLRPAMAAALFIIIIQGGFIMNTLQQPASYAPLGQQHDFPVVLQIEFQPDATEESIRKLLGLVEGRLIDGPGAVGLYRVSLDLVDRNEDAIENRIKVLRAYAGVVHHVSRD